MRQQVDFVMGLHDREALLPRERQRRFLQSNGWVAWPGPAAADLMRQFVVHNRLLRGGFVIEDQLVTLADLTCPILCFVGDVDQIGVPAAVRAIGIAAPRATIYERSLRAGHFGLVVGGQSTRVTWPTVAAWALSVEQGSDVPDGVVPLREATSQEVSAPGLTARVGHGLGLAVGVGVGITRGTVGAASNAASSMVEFAEEAAMALPRLGRLERIQPHTRISLGMLLAERAEHQPEDPCFLFEGRVHRQGAVGTRIDNVVRGLISRGVRQGEHVGVIMNTRPSALVLIAALNRLGAVGVLMRPDGPIAREAELGEVTRVIADPESAGAALAALGVHDGFAAVPVLVLGGGGSARDLGPEVGPAVVDMEQIDPDAVRLPRWFQANPGRARDIAFVLFTGEGERTRANRITNGRWALSAFGTASSAALTTSDTVYSVTPLYHPSALLMSVGGAVAGGARLALAARFDVETFWTDVRRYGVTVCSYTWTSLHAIVDAPSDVAERHHPIRLFIGSGMPRGLWRRVGSRFAPARVLEFYASTEGAAVLVNLSGVKPGAKGRRLPGSARVRVAAYDPVVGRLIEREDGFARECAVGETGMLLAQVGRRSLTPSENALRGVFARGDAWMATGDLFRRDEDGDHWLVDNVAALIRTASGVVPALPIQDALGDLDEVELAVVYGVPVSADGSELAVAAVTLRVGPGAGGAGGVALRPAALTRTLAGIEPAQRPSVVRVVAEIPVTTWFRPLAGPLRAEGIPPVPSASASAADGAGGWPVWVRDAGGGGYRPMTAASRRRLLSGARARTRASIRR
jgi:putative long chain acyl-CoA synthase